VTDADAAMRDDSSIHGEIPSREGPPVRETPAHPAPALVPPPRAGVVNIANAVTVLRILLVPVFVAILVVDSGTQTSWRIGAAIAFVAASLTDRIDGQLARSRGLITDFGQIADPVADKVLIGAAMFTLSWLGELSWWFTALVVVRELGVTVLRVWVIRHGIIPASRGGKVKTLLQAVAVVLYVLPFDGAFGMWRAVVMAAAVVVTVATGADYVARALTLRRTSPRAQLKRQKRAAEAAARRTPDHRA
jgi:CDP-diacylglycerol--glycerol-3-phosphate 3-phosphatidyltransferase